MTTIRSLFIPIQPTIQLKGKNVAYEERLPHQALREYIYCYWSLHSETKLTAPFVYRAVADGCIDIFFEASEPAESFVMGFCKQYTEFPIGRSFHYLGIRFLPTMFPQLFDVAAINLSNQVQPLDLVVPQLADYITHAFQDFAHQDKSYQVLFDDFLLKWNKDLYFDFDDRLYNALHIIIQRQGILQIEKDLKTGLSPRQLRRKFNQYIGTSPKNFGRVVRFQNILRAKPSTQSLSKNKLFYDVGYYDQAHFIKEFKTFYGVPPTTAFGR